MQSNITMCKYYIYIYIMYIGLCEGHHEVAQEHDGGVDEAPPGAASNGRHVCMYVYIYIYIYTYSYSYTHILIYICMYIYIYNNIII